MQPKPSYLRVKFERHARRWSQKDVAARTGIPQQVVSAIESGRIIPSEQELDRLADAFLVSPSSVLMKPCTIRDPEEVQAEEAHA